MIRKSMPFVLAILLLIALLAPSSPVVPSAQCFDCDRFRTSCIGAAQAQKKMCLQSGGTDSECLDQFFWFYETCMAGTGCPLGY